MREILFRGKDVRTGYWKEGSLVREWLGVDIGYTIRDVPDRFNQIAFRSIVDPKTVGQFTGLTDKSGKKIFEGDILSIAQKGNGVGDYFYPPLKYPSNAIVKWDKCSWMWEIIAEQRYYLTFPDAWCHFECKVIGNIYDNPELLEVDK